MDRSTRRPSGLFRSGDENALVLVGCFCGWREAACGGFRFGSDRLPTPAYWPHAKREPTSMSAAPCLLAVTRVTLIRSNARIYTRTFCLFQAKPLVLLSLLREAVGQRKQLTVVFTSSVDSTHRLSRLLQLFGGEWAE